MGLIHYLLPTATADSVGITSSAFTVANCDSSDTSGGGWAQVGMDGSFDILAASLRFRPDSIHPVQGRLTGLNKNFNPTNDFNISLTITYVGGGDIGSFQVRFTSAGGNSIASLPLPNSAQGPVLTTISKSAFAGNVNWAAVTQIDFICDASSLGDFVSVHILTCTPLVYFFNITTWVPAKTPAGLVHKLIDDTPSLPDDLLTSISTRSSPVALGSKTMFSFAPLGDSDVISSFVITIRAKAIAGQSQKMDVYFRGVGGTAYTIKQFTTMDTTQFVNYTITTDPWTPTGPGSLYGPNNPETSVPWVSEDFGTRVGYTYLGPGELATTSPGPFGALFGVGATDLGSGVNQVIITQMYLTVETATGLTDGPRRVPDNWRYCDQCGKKVRYASIRRPVPPHPQAGLLVCPRCYDEIDHETRKIMSKGYPRERDGGLY